MDPCTKPYSADLGTTFEHDSRSDLVVISSPDGSEVEIPAPDLREFVDFWLVPEQALAGEAYCTVFERTRKSIQPHTARIDRERREAPALIATLLSLTPRERSGVLRPGSRFCTMETASISLEGARRAVHESPSAGRELAELGSRIATVLSPDIYGSERIVDLQAYSKAVLANSLRVAGDLREASRALWEARRLLRSSSATSLEAIEIDNLETSVRRDLHDFIGALELSRRVVDSFVARGMTESAVRALLKRAVIFELMCEPDAAVEVLREAETLGQSLDDPWTCLMLQHNLTFYLARAGRFDEAESQFMVALPLYEQFEKPWVTGRRRWVEGLLLQHDRDALEALRRFETARSLFAANGYPIDAAQVSLDLAGALAEEGRFAEVRELAAATYALFESQGVHRDALAALTQFQQAAARETLDREVLRQIAQRLNRAAELRPLPA